MPNSDVWREHHYIHILDNFNGTDESSATIWYHGVPCSQCMSIANAIIELIDAPLKSAITTWDVSVGQNSSFTAMDKEVADAAWAEIQVTKDRALTFASRYRMADLFFYRRLCSPIEAANATAWQVLSELCACSRWLGISGTGWSLASTSLPLFPAKDKCSIHSFVSEHNAEPYSTC